MGCYRRLDVAEEQPKASGGMTAALDGYCGPQSELAAHRGQLAAVWIAFFVVAGITYHAPAVLLPALMHEFGTTQYGISWLPAIFQLCKGLSTLPGGYVVHALGASRCMRWGAVVVLLATACYPFGWSLWMLAVLHGVLGASYNLIGLAPAIVFATSWFEAQRALAIGILVTGFSMAGVVFPPALAWLVQHSGWRSATGVAAGLIAAVVLPLAGALRDGPLAARAADGRDSGEDGPLRVGCPRRRPASATAYTAAEACAEGEAAEDVRLRHVVGHASLDLGLEDASGAPAPAVARGSEPQLTFAQSLRLGAVWHLAFVSLYQLYIVIALLNTLILYLKTDAGFPLELCGLYNSSVFVFSVIGKLLIGAALDTSYQRLAGMGSCITLVLGTCLALELGGPQGVRPTSSHWRLFLFTVVYGLGYGASYSVISSKPAKMFGAMPEFSKLQGFLMLFQVIGGFSGTLLTGKLRAMTGSYGLPFAIFVGMGVLGCVHYFLLELGQAHAHALANSEREAAERSTRS